MINPIRSFSYKGTKVKGKMFENIKVLVVESKNAKAKQDSYTDFIQSGLPKGRIPSASPPWVDEITNPENSIMGNLVF